MILINQTEFYFNILFGCPRNLSRFNQNSMATVRAFGKPDLFITIACNPQWPEILSELKEVENSHTLTIIARIFKLKLQAILDDISNKNIFG